LAESVQTAETAACMWDITGPSLDRTTARHMRYFVDVIDPTCDTDVIHTVHIIVVTIGSHCRVG